LLPLIFIFLKKKEGIAFATIQNYLRDSYFFSKKRLILKTPKGTLMMFTLKRREEYIPKPHFTSIEIETCKRG
jgi:hypothetical protein